VLSSLPPLHGMNWARIRVMDTDFERQIVCMIDVPVMMQTGSDIRCGTRQDAYSQRLLLIL
jgi:hypothetical protein